MGAERGKGKDRNRVKNMYIERSGSGEVEEYVSQREFSFNTVS